MNWRYKAKTKPILEDKPDLGSVSFQAFKPISMGIRALFYTLDLVELLCMNCDICLGLRNVGSLQFQLRDASSETL